MPIEEETPPWRPYSSHWRCFKYVVLGGLAAGVSFLVYETIAFLLLSGNPTLPLKLFAASLFGWASVAGAYPMASLLMVGIASAFGMSILAAFLFVVFLAQYPRFAASTPVLVTSSCVYSYFLWVLDLALISLNLPEELHRQMHPGIHGFAGHVFFYGMVLGIYLDRYQEKRARISRLRFRF